MQLEPLVHLLLCVFAPLERKGKKHALLLLLPLLQVLQQLHDL